MMKKFVIILFNTDYNETTSWMDYIDVFSAVISVVLGVVTIILGLNYIQQKRREAKFGFYINFHVIIKRIKYLFEEYPEITDYLVDEGKRNEFSALAVNGVLGKKILPAFLSACDDFLSFISSANNNIVPKSSKKENDEEWKKWYDSIYSLVLFSQKCQLLKNGVITYVSDKEVEQYHLDKEEFKSALMFFDKKLDETLKSKK